MNAAFNYQTSNYFTNEYNTQNICGHHSSRRIYFVFSFDVLPHRPSYSQQPQLFTKLAIFQDQTALCMMTSSNGNIFRVTGPLCGEFTGPGEFPTQRPVTRSFDVLFDLRLNKRLSKQPWGWWFETPSWSLWRQRNGLGLLPCKQRCRHIEPGTSHWVESCVTRILHFSPFAYHPYSVSFVVFKRCQFYQKISSHSKHIDTLFVYMDRFSMCLKIGRFDIVWKNGTL